MKAAKREKKIEGVLSKMQMQLAQTKKLQEAFEKQRLADKSPSEARQLIEHIEIPALEILQDRKETPKKKGWFH